MSVRLPNEVVLRAEGFGIRKNSLTSGKACGGWVLPHAVEADLRQQRTAADNDKLRQSINCGLMQLSCRECLSSGVK